MTLHGASRKLEAGLILLFEDRDILVIDKPAGLLSVAVPGSREKTAYWILARYLDKKGEKRRPAAVHRLDRDTSGLMIFAKSAQTKKIFMENWNEMVKTRRYRALACGRMPGKSGIIDVPLGEDRSGRVVAAPDGIPALTHWRLLFQGERLALLDVEPETGRRNQIRAHFAWLGRPLAGDRKYAAPLNPGRLCLHAAETAFFHPRTGKFMEFSSPTPKIFAPR